MNRFSQEKLKNISQLVGNRKRIYLPFCKEKQNEDSSEPEPSNLSNFSSNISRLKIFEELDRVRISKCSINLKENIVNINDRKNLKPLNKRECSSVLKNITNPRFALNTHTLNTRTSSKAHIEFENIYSNLYPESTKVNQKQDKKGNFSQRARKRGSKR